MNNQNLLIKMVAFILTLILIGVGTCFILEKNIEYRGKDKKENKVFINYYYEGNALIKVYFSNDLPGYDYRGGSIKIIDTNGVEVILLNGRVESEKH